MCGYVHCVDMLCLCVNYAYRSTEEADNEDGQTDVSAIIIIINCLASENLNLSDLYTTILWGNYTCCGFKIK